MLIVALFCCLWLRAAAYTDGLNTMDYRFGILQL